MGGATSPGYFAISAIGRARDLEEVSEYACKLAPY